MSRSRCTGDHLTQMGLGETLHRVGIRSLQCMKDFSMAVPSCAVNVTDRACDDRTCLGVEGSERGFGGALMDGVGQVLEEVRMCAERGQRVPVECGR